MNYLIKKSKLLLCCCILTLNVSGQEPISEMNGFLQKGHVSGMMQYFDNAISLTISGNQAVYSRSQAEMILKDFFEKHAPRNFRMDHSGGDVQARYVIGSLVTATGSFRTYYALKQKDGKYTLLEIRFED